MSGLPSHKIIQFAWKTNKEENITESFSKIFIIALKHCLQLFSLFLLFNISADSNNWPTAPLSFDCSLTQFKLPSGGSRAKPALGICLHLCVSAQMMIPLARVRGIMCLCSGAGCTPAGSVHALFCGFLVCQTRGESNCCYFFVIQYTNLF